MTHIRPKQWNRLAFGELDEIVAQLFDDFASGDALIRKTEPVAKRNGPAPSNLHREIDRSEQVSTEETARSPTDGMAGRSPKNIPHKSQIFDSSSVADHEERFTDETWYEGQSASLTLTPEEELFVKHTAAWLAPRPNADLLLERILEVARHQEAGVPPPNGVEIEGGGSERSSEAVRAKPASAAKRP
jgi:hypothetical protein